MQIAIFENESWARAAWQRLEGSHAVTVSEELLTGANVDDHGAAEVVVTDLSQLGPELLGRLGALKLIAARATGVDKVDLEYCRAHGIWVCNVPGYAEFAVAEHVFALLLAVSRRLVPAVDRTRRCRFDFDGLQGFDLHGKTLAVVGTGIIGRRVVEIARGFGMRVLAVDVFPNEQWAAEKSIDYVPLEAALGVADVVTLHVPALKDTYHMLAEPQFEMMKKGVVIINAARGELIDARALVSALASGRVVAAGLDVIEGEQAFRCETEDPAGLFEDPVQTGTQLANHILLRLPNVVVTPHCAFFTREASRRVLAETAANIDAFASGEPRNVIVRGA